MEKMVPLAIIVVFFFYLFADTEQLLARFNLGFLSYTLHILLNRML